jgi:hypothetical protein
MDKILAVAKASFYFASVLCLLFVARLLWIVPDIIKTEMTATRALIDTRVSSLETTANRQLTDWRATTEQQLTEIRTTTDRRISSLEKTTDRHLVALEGETLKRVDQLVASADRNLTNVAGGVNDLTKTYAAIPDRLDTSLKPFTNCAENDFCWQNLVTDSMVSFRAASRDTSATMQGISTTIPLVASDVRKSTDAFATQFPIIVQNTSNITSNIDRLTKPKWYDRVIGYAANGTLIWFNINRAATPSVTVTK